MLAQVHFDGYLWDTKLESINNNESASFALFRFFFLTRIQGNTIFSSSELLGSQGELIVYPYSGVRCRCCHHQQCLNTFSSETALPIKAKFYMEPPWEGGTKVYINGPGHMSKMATMPICGKNL